ncbi:MAG: (Fe-S)-binding protein, partial [bacterium]|nr:(Fe-S)-binding protein [bacterium]
MTSSSEWQSSLPELLRRCVGCGLCLPHCATWAVTGNEVHSPRGRLMLLGDLLDDPSSATRAAYADAFDGCLGCRACESACPGGVPFELLEHGQNLTAGMGVQPSRWVSTLIRHLDSLLVLNFLRRVGKVSRQILKAIWGQHWRRRLNGAGWKLGTLVRLLGSLPAGPSSDQDLVEQLDQLCGTKSNGEFVLPQLQPIQQDCVFFEGCANEGLLPETSRRFKELLKAMGCTVHTLASQQCCGAIADHNNQPGKASRQKRINLKVLTEESCSDFPVVTEAAGCSAHLGQYNQDMQNRTQNAVVFLHELMNTESGNKLFSNLRP